MDEIRYATAEEASAIADIADITPTSSVVTFGGKDTAVIRNCVEVDPVIFSEDTGDKRKLLFFMNILTALRLQGLKEIYFNVGADNEAMIGVMKNMGAEPISGNPEIRFKKVL